MHTQHYTPSRSSSPRQQRAASALLAIAMGLALAELLAQWCMA